MLINLLWGLPAVLLLIGVILLTTKQKGLWWLGSLSASLVTFLIIGSIFGGIYLNKLGQVARLEAFYNANAENYMITASETEAMLSTRMFGEHEILLVEGSIEKINLADVVARRIAEWRNSVNDYNKELSVYRKFQSNIIFGCLYPDCSSDLRLLVIEE